MANLPVDNDRPRLIDVLTQLLPFIRYPQRAEDYRRSRPTSLGPGELLSCRAE